MRAWRCLRFAWVLSLATGGVLGWGLWRPPVGPWRAAGPRERAEGALDELRRERRVQALIRAESTAQLLLFLEARAEAEGGA